MPWSQAAGPGWSAGCLAEHPCHLCPVPKGIFVRCLTTPPACPSPACPAGVGYYLDGTEAVRAARAAKQRQKKEARRQQQQQAAAQQQQQAAGASDSEDEGNMRPMPSTAGGGKGSSAAAAANGGGGLSQAELIRRAFAGDDVAAEFAASKAEEVEGELPKVRGSSCFWLLQLLMPPVPVSAQPAARAAAGRRWWRC